ncbi:MAG: DUF192 domain-containing protein [Steroidobacter sp.]
MKTISLGTADGRCIAHDVRIADTLVARSIGLLRERSLAEHQGLLLVPGGSIHTLGMRFPIDVVFLDRRMRVLNLAPNVAPKRFRLAPAGTARVLELAAGRIAQVGVLIGTYIVVEDEEQVRDAIATTRRMRSHSSLPPECARLPIQFSLRLPPQHRNTVHSNLACQTDRDAAPTTNEKEIAT